MKARYEEVGRPCSGCGEPTNHHSGVCCICAAIGPPSPPAPDRREGHTPPMSPERVAALRVIYSTGDWTPDQEVLELCDACDQQAEEIARLRVENIALSSAMNRAESQVQALQAQLDCMVAPEELRQWKAEVQALRQALEGYEGEGIGGSKLYRCRLCHKGWSVGGSFSTGPQHHPHCPALAPGEAAPKVEAKRECSCTGFCKGRDGLSARYVCALEQKPGKVAAPKETQG